MTKAFQSYTPRVRPLFYDALFQDSGCQDVFPGLRWFGSNPFTRICISEHEAGTSPVFDKSDLVSFCTGPLDTGSRHPWVTRWVAWVGGAGVRVAKLPSITLPALTTGNESSLFPITDTKKISLGFTSNGQMAIAIQATVTSIEVKWFRDGSGASIGTTSFPGISPCLYNNGLLFTSDDSDEIGAVLYYFREEIQGTLFARFEHEDFETERVVNTRLQARIINLAGCEAEGRKQHLYARDSLGRDISLYTEIYFPRVSGDREKLAIAVKSGKYTKLAVNANAGTDGAKMTIGVFSGSYNDPIQEPASALSGDKGTLTVGVSSGEYL